MKLAKFLAVFLVWGAAQAGAATCGNDASGFESWKAQFAPIAKAGGIGSSGLSALAGARYSTGTIYA